MSALPPMRSVLELGPSGPFPFDSRPQWFQSEPACRTLDLPAYLRELVDSGLAEGTARRIVQAMSRNGATHVLWIWGAGGRKGRFDGVWDLRLAGMKHDARAVLEEIVTPDRTGHEPRPGTPLAELKTRPEAVTVQLSQQADQVRQVASDDTPAWVRALGLRMESRLHAKGAAYVALASGSIGATVNVAARTLEGRRVRAQRIWPKR